MHRFSNHLVTSAALGMLLSHTATLADHPSVADLSGEAPHAGSVRGYLWPSCDDPKRTIDDSNNGAVPVAFNVLRGASYPDFSLAYHEDFLTYQLCEPIGLQAPERWTSMPTTLVRIFGFFPENPIGIQMLNVARNVPPVEPNDPDFTIVPQAATLLPNVTYNTGVRGWSVKTRSFLTDGDTSRVWRVQMSGDASGEYLDCTSIAFSSVTGTYWLQVPNPADTPNGDPPVILPPIWINTNRSPASLAINFFEYFDLTIHMNPNGTLMYRLNNHLLTDFNQNTIYTEPLRSMSPQTQVRRHRDLDRIVFLSGDDDYAAMYSSMLVVAIRAWATPCPGDANGDGVMDFTDFSLVLANYGATGANVPGNIAPDADGDGVPDDNVVNFTDFAAVLNNYGAACD